MERIIVLFLEASKTHSFPSFGLDTLKQLSPGEGELKKDSSPYGLGLQGVKLLKDHSSWWFCGCSKRCVGYTWHPTLKSHPL
jgi:hypothetical protein